MAYIDIAKKIKHWLNASGLEFKETTSSEYQGCSYIVQEESHECILMLPEKQEALYFISELYTPNLEQDADLITYCLSLNAHAVGIMKTAAIGLDTDNQKIIFRNVRTISAISSQNLTVWLSQFLARSDFFKRQINDYRTANGLTPDLGEISLYDSQAKQHIKNHT